MPKLFPNGHAYTALQYYEKTLDIYQNIFPANHPETIKMNATIENVVPLILSLPKKMFSYQ